MSNILRAVLVTVVSLVFVSSAAAQGVEDKLNLTREQIQTAAAKELNLISPEHYAKAMQKLVEAEGLYKRGARINDIERRLGESIRELERARSYEEVGRVLLREALEARGAALEANAPEFAPREWEEARRSLRRAGEAVESGNQNRARERAAEATRNFQVAEIEAIRKDVIGRARQLQAEARRVEADEKARTTYAKADSLLAQAENAIRSGGRESRGEASRLAAAAAEAYQHAARIATLTDRVSRDEKRQTEQLVLEYEDQIGRVAAALSFVPSFAEGPEPVVDRTIATIESLYQDRDNLRQELASRAEQLARAQAQVDSLQVRLVTLADSLGAAQAAESERRRQVAAALRAREMREAKVNQIRSTFTGTEAEVLERGGELLIRLYGLNFPVGSAEITPANFGLLTKLQSAIRTFPDAQITIAGHSDAQGNDEFNQKLSERRAQAVREYLLANMGLPEDRIAAVGFGESQPIATNETAEGRAKNRRIDVVLTLP